MAAASYSKKESYQTTEMRGPLVPSCMSTRAAAFREMTTNSEAQKPSLEMIFEFDGLRMERAMESAPHSNTQAHNCTNEGAGLIQRFEEGDPDDIRSRRVLAREQMGMEIPLRPACAYSPPKNPWPREGVRDWRYRFCRTGQKRKIHWKKQGQGNSWDQYGDSSSAASPSASAEEGGKETHSVSE